MQRNGLSDMSGINTDMNTEPEPSQQWHPWRYAADNLPHITIDCTKRLPKGVSGLWRGNIIWICSSLNRRGRRSTLTHEIHHVERGVVPPWIWPREERTVDKLAAQLLIPIDSLLDVLRWSNHEAEVAEILDVDEHTVRVRLAYLTDAEKDYLTAHLDDVEVSDEWA